MLDFAINGFVSKVSYIILEIQRFLKKIYITLKIRFMAKTVINLISASNFERGLLINIFEHTFIEFFFCFLF